MWKGAVAVASLLLIGLTIQFWPTGHGPARRKLAVANVRPLTAAEARTCAKKILRDWIPDSRVEGTYRRECYESACAMFSSPTNYGGPNFCGTDAEERLRTGG